MLTGCTGDDISDQSTPEPTETTITEPTTTDDTTSIAGTYIETYKDAIPEDWKRRTRHLFQDLSYMKTEPAFSFGTIVTLCMW